MLQLTPRDLSAFYRLLSVLQRRRLRVFRNLLELQFSDLQTVSEMVAVSLNGSRSKLELWAMLQFTPRILSSFFLSLSVLQRRLLRVFCNLLELQFSDLQTVSEMVAVSLRERANR